MQVSTSTRHCLLVHIFQPTCITYQYQQQQLSNCKRQKTCSVQTIQGIEFIYLVNGCSKVFTESPTVNDWRISTTTKVFSHHESTCHILLPPGGPLIAVLDQKQLEMHVVALLYTGRCPSSSVAARKRFYYFTIYASTLVTIYCAPNRLVPILLFVPVHFSFTFWKCTTHG